MLIVNILNFLHFLVVFIPIGIYLVDLKYIKNIFPYFVLIALLTPLHWIFFENKCISTILTQKMGDFKDTQTSSSFSEKYLKWLYHPLMKHIFNLEWNDEGLDKMVHIHWIFNFILLWYFIFFRYC